MILYCQPAGTCCCGCSLDLGIKLLLVVNGVLCFFYMYTAFSNLVLDVATMGEGVPYSTQAFNCGFSILSIPFVASGFSGVMNDIAIHLRIYLYWYTFIVSLDICYCIALLFQTSCEQLPASLLKSSGAFACGAMRLFQFSGVVFYVGIAAYLIFIIWSRCEQLDRPSSADVMKALAASEHGPKTTGPPEGLFGVGRGLPKHDPLAYGSLAAPSLGESIPIDFNNRWPRKEPEPSPSAYC